MQKEGVTTHFSKIIELKFGKKFHTFSVFQLKLFFEKNCSCLNCI